MRILILGGTGAMGQPLVRLLEEGGHEVYVTSRQRHESKGSIHFVVGDAHDMAFMQAQLKKHYDAIVDFMIYSTEAFKKRVNLYLESTGQYMFLSSARVYAGSREPITEESPRLLDVCGDEEYLNTDEYALAKARSENVLFCSANKNWTIIRPYITYNTKRLQLGGLELETWLTAALSGRPLVLPEDVGVHETTMACGEDVAKGMALLIGNPKALGEAFHITGMDHMKWKDAAEIYCDVIGEFTGCCPSVYAPETSVGLSAVMGNGYQIKYDRMYDRVFDNTKLEKACAGSPEIMTATPMDTGLRRCLKRYLSLPGDQRIKNHNVKFEAWVDRAVGEKFSLREMKNSKEKLKYFGFYHMPGIMEILKRLK